jgi:hypothetical protein
VRCADCRFWERYNDADEPLNHWGDCGRAGNTIDSANGALMVSFYYGFSTYQTFGCVQFEAKDNA